MSKSLLFVSTTFMIVKHTQTVLSLPLSYFYCLIVRSGVGGAGELLFDWKVLERFDILIMAQDGDFIIRHQFSCSWYEKWSTYQKLRARRCGLALCFESVVEPGGANHFCWLFTFFAGNFLATEWDSRLVWRSGCGLSHENFVSLFWQLVVTSSIQ